jgi:hypothetical protein
MKTKERIVPGAQITRSAMIVSMRKLVASEEWRRLVMHLGAFREKKLDEGKKTLNPHVLSWVDGFDASSKFASDWANKQLPEELPNYNEGEQE